MADGGKGAQGRKKSAAKVHFPWRHRSVALLSSTAQLSKSSERRQRIDGEFYPNKAQTPAVRSFWPCLVDLHSQHPVPTIHLTPSNSISCTGAELLVNLPNGGSKGQTLLALSPPLESL